MSCEVLKAAKMLMVVFEAMWTCR